MTVRGHFAEVATTADIDPGHPEKSSVEATIQARSVRTNNEIRDNDLRSEHFLDVEQYPVITFTSTGVEAAGEDRYTLTGDLTIKGNTRPVTLEVTRYGKFNDPGMMGHRIAYGARTKINRRDFGADLQRRAGRPAPAQIWYYCRLSGRCSSRLEDGRRARTARLRGLNVVVARRICPGHGRRHWCASATTGWISRSRRLRGSRPVGSGCRAGTVW